MFFRDRIDGVQGLEVAVELLSSCCGELQSSLLGDANLPASQKRASIDWD